MIQMRDKNSTEALIEMLNYMDKWDSMIEIGSYAGESTKIFAERMKRVIAIDPFMDNYDPLDPACQDSPLNEVYQSFIKVQSQFDNIFHYQLKSDEAINYIGFQVDFVYIDGMHTYEQVKKDLINYLPVCKYYICGHDYVKGWDGVIQAVDEIIGKPDKIFKDYSWVKRII